jgi:serine/threonine protein phosphatase 1
MATIAIGDVHGNLRALSDLLDQLRSEVTGGDTVVMLGDYIDRGPDSKGCIDAILAFGEQVPATVVGLCGNHEDWMLQTMGDCTRHSWLLGMQPLETIQSYSPEAARAVRKAAREAGLRLYTGSHQLPYHLFFEALPPAHRAFFGGLRSCFQAEDCICVHAGVHPGFAADAPHEHPRNSLVWGARDFPEAYAGASTVVYGHHNNADIDANGWPHPRVLGATIGIDTIAHGVLTAMRFPDRRVFQSARYSASWTEAEGTDHD